MNRRLIAPLVLGAALNPVNSSMIAVALVPIGIAFDALPAETSWLVSALYLATATGQPVVGRLVDRYGPRTLYLIGSAMVGVAGLIGTLAPSLAVLVVARVILGIGTCAGYPAAMYLLKRARTERPGSVLTLLTVAAQTIVVIGPTIGGLLITAGGWRTVFAVNIPLAAACLILGALRLPRTARVPGPRFDYLGTLLFAATLTSLMLALMGRYWFLALTLIAGAAFVTHQLRIAEPFIDLRVFGGNGPLIRTYLRTLMAQTITYAFLYGFTQWLQAGRGLSPSVAGLVLLPMSLVAIGGSALTGRSTRFRLVLLVGALTQIAACALLLPIGSSTAVWVLVLIAAACGLPQGINNLVNQNAVYHQADPARIGAAAGLLRTFTYLGALVAAAAFAHQGAGLRAFAVFLLAVSTLMLLLVCVETFLVRRTAHQPTSPEPVPSAT
ncbi:MFS family permease [Actinoplanes lutulentus]|uniref:Putative MFS family arabinose efflux permease n=1 Tax=Actinoplanes lutulentus TaxID=1287878 RepID=A0A327Z1R7_9ACTN|nr:MFS transporter [Actinoplanes lutulentus]MBB2943028.1 MFS family permease [Actinoplanes lutulentus]RAK26705.1 putative MFS family arabinose efflux permease [Actinoplanes lutulentus]